MIFKPCSVTSKSSFLSNPSSQCIISSLTRYYSRLLVLVNNQANCQRNCHTQGDINMANNDAGRINLEEAMQKDKERYLKMDLQSKRKFYAVGKKFVELPTISSWTLFSLTNHINGKSGETYKFNEKINNKVSLYIGDITALEIDCIVNAANKKLAGGSGVDGAIHRAAGIDLLKRECKLLNGCEPGDAKITGGYRLPAKYVIHTVGPIGEKPDLLKGCYKRCLEVMKENNLKSIAFPCISTGAYRYPNKKAAEVALSTVREWMDQESEYVDQIDRIIFCLFMAEDIEIYKKLMPVYFPTKDE